jgi:hypothetical protein
LKDTPQACCEHEIEDLVTSIEKQTGNAVLSSWVGLELKPPNLTIQPKGISMRLRSSLLLHCLLLSALPLFLHAQFQEPSKADLQMSDDPKSPGAAAIYLNVAEETNDPLHYHAFYARIKVLQEKGKELATVTIPYHQGNFKVTDIKGRTIHADGTVVPLKVKPEDLLSFKEGANEIGKVVFTLPSVEVGSILEYRYQIRYGDNHFSSPFWELQRGYSVQKAHYSFTPFGQFLSGNGHAQHTVGETLLDAHGNAINSLIWWKLLPPGVDIKSDPDKGFTLDVSDIRAIPDEDFMPPSQSFLYHVLFYYKSAFDSGGFWQSESKRWAKEVDHFAEPSKDIHAAVAQLTAPGDSDLDKAKKLYKAVQALDNSDYSRKKGASELKALGLHAEKRAEDTWTQKGGSSEDIALLYLTMLRAAGLQAWDMKVVDRERAVFASDYLSFDQLDDDIVILNIGDKEIFLDPGEKMCPFGLLSWRQAGASGIRESANGPAPATSPTLPYTANEIQRSGTAYLDEHGGMTGSFRFLMKGQEALHWRQQAILNDLDEVKKQFDRMLRNSLPETVDAQIDHFIGLDDPELNLVAVINAKGTVGTLTSKRLLLPGYLFEGRGHRPFVNQPNRESMIDMHFGERVIDQVVYQFPSSFTVEGAPQNASVQFPSQAVLDTRVTVAPGQVAISRSLARAFTFLKPEQYQDLRAFYQKVDANDQEQVSLLVGAEPKGK